MSAMPAPYRHSAVELVEEALALLRRTPVALAWYLVGAVPFWLSLLWYLSDMTHGAFARQRCLVGALAVAALYIWKRAAQSRAGAWLRAAAVDAIPVQWTWRDWFAIAGLHARYSSWSLFAAVPALLALAPVGWWLAWHETLTGVCDQPSHDVGAAPRRAWAAARSDPGQTHLILGIFSIAAPFIAVNLAIVLLLLPSLVRALFGVRWTFAMHEGWMLQGAFALIVLAVTHLIVDPSLKATYALHAFSLEARRTGADLRAEWRRCRAAVLGVALITVALGPSLASAAPTDPPTASRLSAEDFNAAADHVLARPEFAWRLPKDARPEAHEPASLFELALRWTGRQFAMIGRGIRRIFHQIEEWLRRREAPSGDWLDHGSDTDWVRPTAWAVLIVTATLLMSGLIRGARRRFPTITSSRTSAAASMDVETILATCRPYDEWSELARQLAAVGDHRRALRAAFLATLSRLSALGWIDVRPARTNRDYRIELERRALVPELVRRQFMQWTTEFERCWYGAHDIDPRTVHNMLAGLETWRDGTA